MSENLRRIPTVIFALTASLWLSACESLPEGEESGPTAAQPEDTTMGAASEPNPMLDDLPHPPEVAVLTPPIDDDPEQLMGLDRGGLGALLGKPALVRQETPAEIWQYQAEDCVFDVFLYDEGGRYLVSYLEARDGQARKTEARPCLNRLLRAQTAAPIS